MASGVSRTIPALILELVEGPTLADRIARGPILVDEALAIARQVIDALEAARPGDRPSRPRAGQYQGARGWHRQGARLRPRQAERAGIRDRGADGATAAPTITGPAMTQMGVILGTAAYMSPEQARGKAVDKRGGVWAFGCVLYEMLTGRRAFEDEDVSMTLSKVLQREPDVDRIPADVPARVRQTIRRCLRKPYRTRAEHPNRSRRHPRAKSIAIPISCPTGEPCCSLSRGWASRTGLLSPRSTPPCRACCWTATLRSSRRAVISCSSVRARCGRRRSMQDASRPASMRCRSSTVSAAQGRTSGTTSPGTGRSSTAPQGRVTRHEPWPGSIARASRKRFRRHPARTRPRASRLTPLGSRWTSMTRTTTSGRGILRAQRLTRMTFDRAIEGDPVWTPDGRRIAFRSNRGGGSFNLFWRAAEPQPILEWRYFRFRSVVNGPRVYDVSPDGKRFLAIKDENGPAEARPQIVLILNGTEELRRRVPVE